MGLPNVRRKGVRNLEDNKIYLLHFGSNECVAFTNLADAQEMYMDLTVDNDFDCFCEWFHFWEFDFEESLKHPDEVVEYCYIEEVSLL